MVQCKAQNVLFDAFEMRQDGVDFGIFRFFVHDFEHVFLFMMLVGWLLMISVETDFNISLQMIELRIIKEI